MYLFQLIFRSSDELMEKLEQRGNKKLKGNEER